MSFCQICRHESPGHEPNCPVLTQHAVLGVTLPVRELTQQAEELIIQLSRQGWKDEEGRERCYSITGEVAYNALEHAYNALGALQDCCKGEDSGFYQNALRRLREIIDEVDDKLP